MVLLQGPAFFAYRRYVTDDIVTRKYRLAFEVALVAAPTLRKHNV